MYFKKLFFLLVPFFITHTFMFIFFNLSEIWCLESVNQRVSTCLLTLYLVDYCVHWWTYKFSAKCFHYFNHLSKGIQEQIIYLTFGILIRASRIRKNCKSTTFSKIDWVDLRTEPYSHFHETFQCLSKEVHNNSLLAQLAQKWKVIKFQSVKKYPIFKVNSKVSLKWE